MFRKTIIVVLTLVAGATAVAFILCAGGIELGYHDESFGFALHEGLLSILTGELPGPYGWNLGTHPPRELIWLPMCHTGVAARAVCVPLWLIFILFAAYPTVAFIQSPARQWVRRRRGLCVACGYDLTGNVSGVCPECGRDL